jgi:deoxyribonuclease V
MDTVNYDGIKIPEATRIQKELGNKLQIQDYNSPITTIAGADISLNLYSTTIYAGIMVLHYPSMQPVAYSLVKDETGFPYVPGYLAFREAPALHKVWEQIPEKPDILVVDGHGIAHPRRMGIAAHFGAVANHATIGCAKNLLFGKYSEPSPEKGSAQPIMDKAEQIGWAYRSKSKTNPVYVSPGHMVGMQQSLDILKTCTGKYRIPEPTRLAHELVNQFRKGELQVGYHLL